MYAVTRAQRTAASDWVRGRLSWTSAVPLSGVLASLGCCVHQHTPQMSFPGTHTHVWHPATSPSQTLGREMVSFVDQERQRGFLVAQGTEASLSAEPRRSYHPDSTGSSLYLTLPEHWALFGSGVSVALCMAALVSTCVLMFSCVCIQAHVQSLSFPLSFLFNDSTYLVLCRGP